MERDGERRLHEELQRLRGRTQRLSLFSTVLIAFLSVCVLYLLFLSSDNQVRSGISGLLQITNEWALNLAYSCFASDSRS